MWTTQHFKLNLDEIMLKKETYTEYTINKNFFVVIILHGIILK